MQWKGAAFSAASGFEYIRQEKQILGKFRGSLNSKLQNWSSSSENCPVPNQPSSVERPMNLIDTFRDAHYPVHLRINHSRGPCLNLSLFFQRQESVIAKAKNPKEQP